MARGGNRRRAETNGTDMKAISHALNTLRESVFHELCRETSLCFCIVIYNLNSLLLMVNLKPPMLQYAVSQRPREQIQTSLSDPFTLT